MTPPPDKAGIARAQSGSDERRFQRRALERRMMFAVGPSSTARELAYCAELATACGVLWYAVHIECVQERRSAETPLVGELLEAASLAGASIVAIPALSVADGLSAQAAELGVTDLILGHGATARNGILGRPLVERIASRIPAVGIQILPRSSPDDGAPLVQSSRSMTDVYSGRQSATSFAQAVGLVAATTLLGEPAWLLAGSRGLDLLFLAPVIAAAVRLGLTQGIFAALLSVLAHNFFFLQPQFSFALARPQTILMSAALVAVAVYTGMLAGRMRRRVALSDRSARDNALVVSFAQELARASDWRTTGEIVCREISALLDVQTVLIREKDDKLVVEAALPAVPTFGPIDWAALEWGWAEARESGLGTSHINGADWQFRPLSTSLGMLAMLAIAREDGSGPIPATKRVLLATLIAQAALAHERLRLEDQALAQCR